MLTHEATLLFQVVVCLQTLCNSSSTLASASVSSSAHLRKRQHQHIKQKIIVHADQMPDDDVLEPGIDRDDDVANVLGYHDTTTITDVSEAVAVNVEYAPSDDVVADLEKRSSGKRDGQFEDERGEMTMEQQKQAYSLTVDKVLMEQWM